MMLRNMLKKCLVFCKSEPQYAYKRYAYKRKNMYLPMIVYLSCSKLVYYFCHFYSLEVLSCNILHKVFANQLKLNLTCYH